MIYILNKYPLYDKGHFWVVDKYIRRGLNELSLTFSYLNLSASSACEEDRFPTVTSHIYQNLDSFENYLSDATRFMINHSSLYPKKNALILITWLPQFSESELENIDKVAELISAKVVGISLPTSEALLEKGNQQYRYVHERFFPLGSKNMLWVGESAYTEFNLNSNIRFLPEFGEVKEFEDTKKIWDISFFGQLSTYRGLSEILITALLNPKLRIRIKGYSFASHRTFRPIRRKLFRYKNWRSNPVFAILFSFVSIPISILRFLPNVSFSNEPFATESDLDQAMYQTRAIFYGAKLPHGSGIMTKSLSAGIPILWTGWDGQAFRFLKSNFDSGFVKFHEFFIPNRVSHILERLPTLEPKRDEMWNRFVKELSVLGDSPK